MTREEAIKIINCYDIGFYDLSGEKIPADKLVDAFDMAIEALSAEPEKIFCSPDAEWFPCSERLPKDYHAVNVTWVNRKPEPYYEHIKDKPFTATACYLDGQWYWYSCVVEDYLAEYGYCEMDRTDKDIEITAWQPLPEPYKGGDNE